jgi:hypothetical protein
MRIRHKEYEMGERVARMGETRNPYSILVENLKGRDHHLEDLGIDGNVILECIGGELGTSGGLL